MIDANKATLILQWVNDLAKLLPRAADAAGTPETWTTVLRNYADFLYSDFPSTAFSRESLKAMTAENEYFPTYKQLLGQLGQWWRENRPVQGLIESDEFRGWSEMDRHWLAYYYRRRDERFSPTRGAHFESPGGRALVLSLIRCQSPRAARYIEATP